MSDTPKTHGTLENWFEVGGVIYGAIYGDTKLRFPDGCEISTSTVLSRNGEVITTRNSTYTLGAPRVTPKSQTL